MTSRDGALRVLSGVVFGGATVRLAATQGGRLFQVPLLGLIQYYGVFVFVFLIAVVAALITSSLCASREEAPEAKPSSKLPKVQEQAAEPADEQAESPSEDGALPAASGDSENSVDLGSVWTDFLMSGIGQLPAGEKKPTKLEEMKARRRRKAGKVDNAVVDVQDPMELAEPEDLRTIDELLEGLGDVKLPKPEAGGAKTPSKLQNAKKKRRPRAGSACSASSDKFGTPMATPMASPMASPMSGFGPFAESVSCDSLREYETPMARSGPDPFAESGSADSLREFETPTAKADTKAEGIPVPAPFSPREAMTLPPPPKASPRVMRIPEPPQAAPKEIQTGGVDTDRFDPLRLIDSKAETDRDDGEKKAEEPLSREEEWQQSPGGKKKKKAAKAAGLSAEKLAVHDKQVQDKKAVQEKAVQGKKASSGKAKGGATGGGDENKETDSPVASKFHIWQALWQYCCKPSFDPLAFGGDGENSGQRDSEAESGEELYDSPVASRFPIWKALWLVCCTHTFDPLSFSGEADGAKAESGRPKANVAVEGKNHGKGGILEADVVDENCGRSARRSRADSGEETDCGDTSSADPSLEALDFQDYDDGSPAGTLFGKCPALKPLKPSPGNAERVSPDADGAEAGLVEDYEFPDTDDELGFGDPKVCIVSYVAALVPYEHEELKETRTTEQMIHDFADKLDAESLHGSESTESTRAETPNAVLRTPDAVLRKAEAPSQEAVRGCEEPQDRAVLRKAEAPTEDPTDEAKHRAASTSSGSSTFDAMPKAELLAWLQDHAPEKYFEDRLRSVCKKAKAMDSADGRDHGSASAL
jgi:hypothetical protein